MKKFLSMLLALTLILSMGTMAFADEGGQETETETETETLYGDQETVTITKIYEVTNPGTTSPQETFKFKIKGTDLKESNGAVTVANMPLPTIGNVTYAAGDAGKSETMTKSITITLPTYNYVGIYTYSITETSGYTAGVTYYSEPIKLVVTVQEIDGLVRVAAVHTETEGQAKSDEFSNVYSAGSLAVKKEVTGNMGDKSKDFECCGQAFL